MTDQTWTRVWHVIAVVALALAGFATALAGVSLSNPEDPVARGSQSGVYMAEGGQTMVVQSGGEIEVQSGATFDLQSGATVDFSSGVDLDGADLTVDADADTILGQTGSTDDAADITLGAARDAGRSASAQGAGHSQGARSPERIV